MKSPRRIYLDMVGCRLNQSELERLGHQARCAGHELVGEIEHADLAVVNTCAVTARASADSRKLVRRIGRGGVSEIILTGCWSSLDPEGAASLPAVTRVIPNTKKDHLYQEIFGPARLPFDAEPIQRQPLPGARKRTRAFIKVQDGCDRQCTFCVTTIARGHPQSVPIADIVRDVQSASAGGVKEVVLTGVQLGSWGVEKSTGTSVEHMIQAILTHTDIERIRLSSLEPWNIRPSLIELWGDPRMCRQLHIPLQSGSSNVLRRMARNFSPERYRGLMDAIRTICPEMAISTDIIVGFPGECEADFTESLNFVESIEFSNGHVFHYSNRPGTLAAHYPNQIPFPIRHERSQRMRAIIDQSKRKFQDRFMGRSISVLWESVAALHPETCVLKGFSSEGIRVQAQGTIADLNQVCVVQVERQNRDAVLTGTILASRDQA